MRRSITIPAITALTSQDATAIRAIVNSLLTEILDLEARIAALESVQGLQLDAGASTRRSSYGVRR